MAAVLFDSSVYITALRQDENTVLALRRFQAASLWLSSVVLEELYAGADARDHSVIERLERDFAKARRVLVPNLRDWTATGKALARFASALGYDAIGRGRLTNDALIAASAGRSGITVITSNESDFAKLAGFLPFQWSAY